MDLIEVILREERQFQRLFASYVETDYGTVFYNEINKDSHDSNHAMLLPEFADLDRALDEITSFYVNKGITPRIYCPFVDGYFDKHRAKFEGHSYTIEDNEIACFMILSQANSICVDQKLDIVRLLDWDERVAEDIFIPNDEAREIEVIKSSLQNPRCYLFVGYLDGAAVTATYLHLGDGCTRFDYIATARNYRQQGYARELLGFVVDYCRENNFPNCYQWPAHPASAKICYEAGFRELFRREISSAVYRGSL